MPQRNLPTEFGAIASAISDGAPDDRFGLHRICALLARKTLQDHAGDIVHETILMRRA
jgi:hypothetical protein